MPEVKNRPCFLTPKKLQPEYPLFVFLPGMDGTGQLLRAQTTGLEIAFDIRCFMIPPNDTTNWDELSAQVVELIQAELNKNPYRPVYLCGESFGGCLAIKVALRSPQLFNRIILVNPASSFHLLRPSLQWGSQLLYLLPECVYQFGALVLLPFLASLERMLPSDRHEFLKTIRSVPPNTVVWRLSLIREFAIEQAQLRLLNQPVLLMASANDRLLPSVAEAKRLVQTLPHAQMVVLPHSGHACLLEADINLYQIMQTEDFLDQTVAAIASTV